MVCVCEEEAPFRVGVTFHWATLQRPQQNVTPVVDLDAKAWRSQATHWCGGQRHVTESVRISNTSGFVRRSLTAVVLEEKQN